MKLCPSAQRAHWKSAAVDGGRRQAWLVSAGHVLLLLSELRSRACSTEHGLCTDATQHQQRSPVVTSMQLVGSAHWALPVSVRASPVTLAAVTHCSRAGGAGQG